MKPIRLGIAGVIALVVVAAGVGFWQYHDNPQFCGSCHVMETYLEGWDSPPLLANVHKQKDKACLDCHPFNLVRSAKEVLVYVTGKYENPLEERRLAQSECWRCHEKKTYAEIIPLTPITAESKLNPHESHFGEIECAVCHKMHKTQVYYCAQCKDVGVMPDGWEAPPPP